MPWLAFYEALRKLGERAQNSVHPLDPATKAKFMKHFEEDNTILQKWMEKNSLFGKSENIANKTFFPRD